ncbi:MAG: DUF2339 domain-containing protein [Gammaproteobacteria bacterium]|nr:DUF2339 domain-containing protein [Gammaproteobacteria bacterium]NNM20696.1 DUF2339 domain-containing protein [Gammaproteobacteria bacterium]
MTKIGYALVGAITGVLVLSGGRFAFGAVIGLVIALLLAELRELSSRVRRLENKPLPPSKTATGPVPAASAMDDEPSSVGEQVAAVPDAAMQSTEAEPSDAIPAFGRKRTPPEPNPIVEKVKEWFTTGNVPVKVGVIVSFFGVAFLLKYAVDRNLLNVPMWLRLVFAALFGLVLLVIGWRLRHRMRVYALSLQGGGVGIIYITIFAAFRLYGLLPPLPAFLLLALLTIPAVWLAVVQNARAMAVLAVTGGFLAPVLASTGQGSHVALFSYYLLLNVAIVGIAWFKSWRELNLVGFLFTFGIGVAWGYKYYDAPYFSSTEPFLIAHFLLYQAAAVLFALRQPPKLRGLVDGTLVFGTPIVAFGLQSAMLRHTDYGLAYSALLLAVFYGALAWWLTARGKALGLLRDSYIALGVAFATAAIPLALDARWTASAWAMEGAALVWLGARQSRLLARVAGGVLILMAGAAYVNGGWDHNAGVPLVNANVFGGVLLSLAGFFSARQLGRMEHVLERIAAVLLLGWGIAWWCITGGLEIDDRVRHMYEYPVLVSFFVVSGAVLGLVARKLDWTHARYGALVMLPLLFVTALGRSFFGGHPLESYAALPWLAAAAAHLYVLRPITTGTVISRTWHVAGVLFFAWLVAWELDWWMVVETWSNTAVSLWLAIAGLACWLLRPVFSWPLQVERPAYLVAAAVLLALNLLYIFGFSIDAPGNPLPLPYLPILNPYDVVMFAGLAASWLWIIEAAQQWPSQDRQRRAYIVLGTAAFVLTTLAVVRGVHHLGNVPWRHYSLTRSVEVQAALSIYWGLLGFAGMVLGTQRARRWLWLTGAALMALVVVKLFIIDLGNSGTVARIVSFIGVGALLLVVGYFAPAPPRQPVSEEG